VPGPSPVLWSDIGCVLCVRYSNDECLQDSVRVRRDPGKSLDLKFKNFQAWEALEKALAVENAGEVLESGYSSPGISHKSYICGKIFVKIQSCHLM